MKKMMLLALSLVLSLSAAGCANDHPENTVVATFVMEEVPAEAPETVPDVQHAVEITMGNWEQFFELRPVTEPVMGQDGRAENWDFCYGVFLKPEYEYISGHVDFEIQFDLETYPVSVEAGACQLGEKLPDELESAFQQKTFGLEDFRNQELPQQSGFRGAVAGLVYGGSVREDPEEGLVAEVPANGVLLHAEGSLILRP